MFSSAKNSEGTPSTFVMKGPKNEVIITNASKSQNEYLFLVPPIPLGDNNVYVVYL